MKFITGGRPPIENLYINSHPDITKLITSCWEDDANMRPTMTKILEVLKGYPFDYDKLSL